MKELNQRIYIDALALVSEKKSGVGVTLRQTLRQLSRTAKESPYKIYLIAPLGKAKYLEEYVSKSVSIKTIPLPARVIELLGRLRLLPPVDWFLGSGVYIFPNYRNWPLWKSKSLTYIYDTGFILHPETLQPRNQKYLSRYWSVWAARADRIITITEQVKEEIERYLQVNYAKIDVVYCGVDRKFFSKRTANDIKNTKTKYGVPYDKYILYVGNIEPRKNLIGLLDAHALLPAEYKEKYGVVFVGGDGWLNEEFYRRLEAARNKGQKVFKIDAYVEDEDLPALYSGASLVVHPAIYEGFGMTPLEAMSCETPVIASDIPSIKEVSKEAVIYFDPNNPITITGAIREVLSDNKLKTKLLQSGLERSKTLSWENTAQSLYKIVENEVALGPHRRPLLRKAKAVYQHADRILRGLLGESSVEAYQPKNALSLEQLRDYVYDDFLREQPSRTQLNLLKVYQGSKHLVARILRRAYRFARSR